MRVAHVLGGLVAARGGRDAEAFGLEIVAHHLGEVGLVFDDQDRGGHRGLPG